MERYSRRSLARKIGAAAVAAGLPAQAAKQAETSPDACTISEPLTGVWQFRLDRDGVGEKQGWNRAGSGATWEQVTVPHTWQIHPESSGYMGSAWYRREFDVPSSWAGRSIHIEFEAVYHTARVWVNGTLAGAHERKGYTAFHFDITSSVRVGERNTVAVQADNSFDPEMLPRNNSYDWAPDGGITRPVTLLAMPPVFIERVDVDAEPDLNKGDATLEIRLELRNTSGSPVVVRPVCDVVEAASGLTVLRTVGGELTLQPGAQAQAARWHARLSKARLWHFDHPHLYRLEAGIEREERILHHQSVQFGVRKIEIKEAGFFLNGERVWLMGVERMAGSNPEYGMAEPESWIVHDHNDMKELNCVFTRVHWQQDRRVLDYCDRNGILIQEEVPTWGPKTFEGMGDGPSPAIMQNGLEQLREMIQRDRNHPCIFSWGLCNEVNGQRPAPARFALRMYQEAKRLDPRRPLTYASNSLQKDIGRDVAGHMDYIMWNEYYESWYKADVETMQRNLAEIHRTFPDKPIVISEYGYCECRPEHTGGDARRIEVLRNHTNVYRGLEAVAGSIFFCYNDYRTHIGDKGIGALKQRVHGVVDLFGARKPSFEELRQESAPVERLSVAMAGSEVTATVVTRRRLPAYTLEGYKLRCIAYGFDGLPMEMQEAELPKLSPGQKAEISFRLQEKNPVRVTVDVVRPTGFTVLTARWEP